MVQANLDRQPLRDEAESAKRELFRQIEGTRLQKIFPLDGMIFWSLTMVESGALMLLAASAGPGLILLCGILPVALNLGTVRLGDYFLDEPEDAAVLSESYEAHLMPNFSEADVHEIEMIEAVLQAGAQGDLAGTNKDMGMVWVQAEANYCDKMIHQLVLEYEARKVELSQRHRLEANQSQDLARLDQEYGLKVAHWKQRQTEVLRANPEAYQQWLKNRSQAA